MFKDELDFKETIEFMDFITDYFPEKILKKQKVYFEEKNIVYGSIVKKNKNNIVGALRTLGYVLLDGQVYDFVTHKVYEQYTDLVNSKNEKLYFQVANYPFKNSESKMDLEDFLNYYIRLFKKYRENYKELVRMENLDLTENTYQKKNTLLSRGV